MPLKKKLFLLPGAIIRPATGWRKPFCAKSEIFFIAASAGIKTGTLNPPAVPPMREIGLDISAQSIDTIDSVIRQRDHSDSVSTVFDTADDQCCAV